MLAAKKGRSCVGCKGIELRVGDEEGEILCGLQKRWISVWATKE